MAFNFKNVSYTDVIIDVNLKRYLEARVKNNFPDLDPDTLLIAVEFFSEGFVRAANFFRNVKSRNMRTHYFTEEGEYSCKLGENFKVYTVDINKVTCRRCLSRIVPNLMKEYNGRMRTFRDNLYKVERIAARERDGKIETINVTSENIRIFKGSE